MNNVINPIVVDGWLKDFEVLNSEYKEKPDTYKFDLLEAAVVLKLQAPNYSSIDDPRIVAAIDDDVREKARLIRKYYTKRWFWNALNSTGMSAFRQRAYELLESQTRTVLKKDLGIYVKLPWFYEEDIVYEEFKKELITDDIPNLSPGRGKSQRRLEFLKTSNGWQGKRRTTRYWFKDDNRFLYGIELEMQNPLIPFFEEAIFANPTCVFEAHLVADRIDKMYYYKLNQFKLLKETNG